MKKHRKIIARVATSVDGFIARPDGSYDWLDRPRPRGNYGMNDFFRSIDTIIWGRKTYDQAVARFEGKSLGYGPKVKNYVFAHDPPQSAPPGVEFAGGERDGQVGVYRSERSCGDFEVVEDRYCERSF